MCSLNKGLVSNYVSWTKTAVDHILATLGVNNADRVAMLGEMAAKVLGARL